MHNMLYATWYERFAQLDGVETAFVLSLFHWMKPFTNEGEGETGVPTEDPRQQGSGNDTTKAQKFKPKNLHSSSDG